MAKAVVKVHFTQLDKLLGFPAWCKIVSAEVRVVDQRVAFIVEVPEGTVHPGEKELWELDAQVDESKGELVLSGFTGPVFS